MAPRTVSSRLKKDLVIWLATVGRDGQPHVVPVWYLWDGTSFLLYSVPGRKVRDIAANPHVAMNLNSDPEASDVIRVEGIAKIVRSEPPAYKVPAYVRKYRELIKGFKWTPQFFSEQYHVPIRITPTRIY